MAVTPIDRNNMIALLNGFHKMVKQGDLRFITPARQLKAMLELPADSLHEKINSRLLLQISFVSRVLADNDKLPYAKAATIGVLSKYLPHCVNDYKHSLTAAHMVTLKDFLRDDPFLTKLIRDSFFLPHGHIDQTYLEWFNLRVASLGFKAEHETADGLDVRQAEFIKITCPDLSIRLEHRQCRIL